MKRSVDGTARRLLHTAMAISLGKVARYHRIRAHGPRIPARNSATWHRKRIIGGNADALSRFYGKAVKCGAVTIGNGRVGLQIHGDNPAACIIKRSMLQGQRGNFRIDSALHRIDGCNARVTIAPTNQHPSMRPCLYSRGEDPITETVQLP